MLKFGSDISSLISSMTEEMRDDFFVLIQKLDHMGLDTFLRKNHVEFNCQDVLDKIESTTVYERERKIKKDAAKKGESSIPKERWGVHIGHCCVYHGCKYGDEDCPVVLELEEQKYPCETCSDGMEDDPNRIFKMKK